MPQFYHSNHILWQQLLQEYCSLKILERSCAEVPKYSSQCWMPAIMHMCANHPNALSDQLLYDACVNLSCFFTESGAWPHHFFTTSRNVYTLFYFLPF